MAKSHQKPNKFPYEAFVQQSIERHFRELGFEIQEHPQIDLVCHHPGTDERWHVEAKGHTQASGLDFRTGIGQLIQRMDSREKRYGLAIPDTPQFREQIKQVRPWVRKSLNLHWLLVDKHGEVRTVRPCDDLGESASDQAKASTDDAS